MFKQAVFKRTFFNPTHYLIACSLAVVLLVMGYFYTDSFIYLVPISAAIFCNPILSRIGQRHSLKVLATGRGLTVKVGETTVGHVADASTIRSIKVIKAKRWFQTPYLEVVCDHDRYTWPLTHYSKFCADESTVDGVASLLQGNAPEQSR